MTEKGLGNERYDIPLGFHFKVEFTGGDGSITADGVDVRFQEVSGLSAELGIETYDEGGENRFSHRLPTRAKFNNLILKRGMLMGESPLRKWFEDGINQFSFNPVNVSVKLLNDKGTAISSWEFHSAWPVKWSVSDFKAMENALVIESAELAYQYFERKQTEAKSVEEKS